MEVAGVKPERLALEWASAAEAPLFVRLITTFTDRIKQLGPLWDPEAMTREELNLKLSAASSAVQSVKLRMRFGKFAQQLRKQNGYSDDVIEVKMAEKVNDTIIREMAKTLNPEPITLVR